MALLLGLVDNVFWGATLLSIIDFYQMQILHPQNTRSWMIFRSVHATSSMFSSVRLVAKSVLSEFILVQPFHSIMSNHITRSSWGTIHGWQIVLLARIFHALHYVPSSINPQKRICIKKLGNVKVATENFPFSRLNTTFIFYFT